MFTLVTNTGGRTQLDDLTEVLRVACTDDPVYVTGRGWMLVGDLRWDMTSESRHRCTGHT